MSNIKIVCRKDISNFHDKKSYESKKTENKTGAELIIECSQWFMNTERFFKSVKESLDNYFNSIEKNS